MHTLPIHIACLLVAQIGPQEFPTNPPSAPSVVRSAAPGTSPDLRDQRPSLIPERIAQPAVGAESVAATIPLHSTKSLSRSKALFEQFVALESVTLVGKPFTLLACVERASTFGQQSAAIRAYWQLCTAIGRYNQAEEKLVVLAGITPQFEFERLQIRAAQRSAEAHRAQARLHLLSAQEKLAEAPPLPDDTPPSPPARPSDLPSSSCSSPPRRRRRFAT